MSNAQTYAISTTAVAVFPSSYGEALTVYNSGTQTVYIGDATGLTVGTGFPLSPGSVIGWDKGRALYAVAVTADGAQITLVTNGGAIFDAGAIADAILNAGLAGDIAQAIFLKGAPSTQGTRVGDRFTPTSYVSGSTFANSTNSPKSLLLIPAPPAGKCIILCGIILGATGSTGNGSYAAVTDTAGTLIVQTTVSSTGNSPLSIDMQSVPVAEGYSVYVTANFPGSTGSITANANILYAIGDVA